MGGVFVYGVLFYTKVSKKRKLEIENLVCEIKHLFEQRNELNEELKKINSEVKRQKRKYRMMIKTPEYADRCNTKISYLENQVLKLIKHREENEEIIFQHTNDDEVLRKQREINISSDTLTSLIRETQLISHKIRLKQIWQCDLDDLIISLGYLVGESPNQYLAELQLSRLIDKQTEQINHNAV